MAKKFLYLIMVLCFSLASVAETEIDLDCSQESTSQCQDCKTENSKNTHQQHESKCSDCHHNHVCSILLWHQPTTETKLVFRQLETEFFYHSLDETNFSTSPYRPPIA